MLNRILKHKYAIGYSIGVTLGAVSLGYEIHGLEFALRHLTIGILLQAIPYYRILKAN